MSLRYDVPPIVTVINHRICQCKKNSGIFIFTFSDNLISEDWFFAEGERFLSFWRCHRPRKRAALGVWCGWFKPQLEIRHATALTTSAKHWHRQKAVFYVFLFQCPQHLSTEPRFSLAWCFASFGISDACLGCCFQEVKELKKLRRYLCLW